MTQNIAIITARGGSKRIPKKNIRNFHGKPIIAYSIEAALSSQCFDEVMVSTDDAEIARVAEKFGAKVPFVRSAKNADDFSTTADVLLEVLAEYKKIGKYYNSACCLYPTAVFVTAKKLIEAKKKFEESDADSLITVTKFGFPIQRSLRIDNGLLKFIWPENMNKRSQDLEASYHDCGQFYFLKTQALFEEKRLFTSRSVGFELSEREVQDIDNEEDWKIAEIKYQIAKEKA